MRLDIDPATCRGGTYGVRDDPVSLPGGSLPHAVTSLLLLWEFCLLYWPQLPGPHKAGALPRSQPTVWARETPLGSYPGIGSWSLPRNAWGGWVLSEMFSQLPFKWNSQEWYGCSDLWCMICQHNYKCFYFVHMALTTPQEAGRLFPHFQDEKMRYNR